MRHGNAEAHNFSNDAARKLTQAGIEEVNSTASQFSSYGQKLDALYVSPYVRAQETAQHFLKAHPVDCKKETLNLITPSGNAVDVALWLSQQKADNILLITHQPFAAQLVERLSDTNLPTDFLMRTATLVALEGEFLATECCTLNWVIHAKI